MGFRRKKGRRESQMAGKSGENMKKAALHNLGCKVNSYETEAMQRLLEQNGYEIVPFSEYADVYVVNTCTVTAVADHKSRQMLHRAKKRNPDSIVVAAGCYAQMAGEQLCQDDAVDVLLGNNQKHELIAILQEQERKRAAGKAARGGAEFCGEKPREDGIDANGKAGFRGDDADASGKAKSCGGSADARGKAKSHGGSADARDKAKSHGGTSASSMSKTVDVSDLSGQTEYEALSIDRSTGHTRVFLKVQDGCDQFCSYCIIPYVRGRVRSRPLEDVKGEMRRLAENGCREVVLTGIHLSSYGKDTGESLLSLLRQVHDIEGIARIRLGSLEPKVVTEEFARELSSLPKVCPHFHLSLQSGCDATLRRMNRKYTCEEYRQGLRWLRQYYAHPAITTDVIVGFPGETAEEFEQTRSFLREASLYEAHIFKYSKRQGTRAAEMGDQLSEQEKARRAAILAEDVEKMSHAFESWYLGKRVDVLLEEEVTLGGERCLIGHTAEYVRAAVPAAGFRPNQLASGVASRLSDGHVLLLQ